MYTISSHHLSYVSEKGAPGFPGPKRKERKCARPCGVCRLADAGVPKWPVPEGEWPPSRSRAAALRRVVGGFTAGMALHCFAVPFSKLLASQQAPEGQGGTLQSYLQMSVPEAQRRGGIV